MSIHLQKAGVCIFALLFVLPIIFSFPTFASATTCGTGSNITFTDIGGGQCQAFLTTTGAGQTWTVPSNWNSSNNTIEAIGGGGGGTQSAAAGGGGGEYREISNFVTSSGSVIPYVIGTGGTGEVAPTCGNGSALNGANTTLNTNALIAGGGGGGNSTTDAGGAGGTGGTGAAAHADGGVGGSWTTGSGGPGGGGAGGPHGTGGKGGAESSNVSGAAGGGGNGGSAAGSVADISPRPERDRIGLCRLIGTRATTP